MKSRWFTCILILAAYSVSLAHSVLPHHHYASLLEYREAANGSKQDKDHQHNHDDKHEKGDTGQQLPDGLFFLTHVSNVDFSQAKFSFDQKVKVKIQWPELQMEVAFLPGACFTESLFHIPVSPPGVDSPVLSSRALRAPPSI